MSNQHRILPGLIGCVLVAATLVGCHTPTSVLRQRALDAYAAEDFSTAQLNFEQVANRIPTDWNANYHLGLIALEAGQPLRARTHLEAAYAVRNEGPPSHPETFDIINALTEALFQEGDYPRLIGFSDEVIDQFGRVADYIRKADYLAKMGDHDAAIIAYKQAVKIAPPDDPAPYVALADFYDSLGDRSAAKLQLRYAYTIDPTDEKIANRLRAYGVVPGPTIRLTPAP